MNSAEIGGGWVGRTVNKRYPLLQWLGGAESSGVFLTEAPDQGLRKAAIRLVVAESGDARERAAGWNAASGLEHPYLMRVLGTGECRMDDAAVLYCVTEYADEVLGDVIRERALTPDEARQMLGPLVDALEYLHRQGLVHERLRPAKILAVNDCLKLSPDGVQRAATASRGANAYDTPEAARNTAAGDVWRLGITLVEALTQRTPEWDAPGGGVPALVEKLAEPFARIARECLHGDPAKRCTLARVRELLAGAAEARTEPERKPERKLERGPVSSAQRPGTKMGVRVAGVALLALFAAIEIWLHRQPSAAPEPRLPAPPRAARRFGTPEWERQDGAHSPAAPERPGTIVKRVMPDVPEAALHTIHGTIRISVQVTVNTKGAVNDALIEHAGTSPYFDRFARTAALQWQFTPAYTGGQTVPSAWMLHFELRQNGIEVHPEEVVP